MCATLSRVQFHDWDIYIFLFMSHFHICAAHSYVHFNKSGSINTETLFLHSKPVQNHFNQLLRFQTHNQVPPQQVDEWWVRSFTSPISKFKFSLHSCCSGVVPTIGCSGQTLLRDAFLGKWGGGAIPPPPPIFLESKTKKIY